MADLDFEKNIHTLSDDMDKERICTVIIFIPDGIQGSIQEVNNKLEEAFNKTVTYVGLGHIDSDGFKRDSANIIIVDHKISITDLKNIEDFCKVIDVIPMSMYIKYGDLEANNSCFIGKVIPVENK